MADLLDYALTTLADVKEELGIASSNHTYDNKIRRKINQATEIIEGYTQQRFKRGDYTEEYDGTNESELVLTHRPVNSVASISTRQTATNEDDFDTMEAENYFFDGPAGILKSALSGFWGRYNRYKVIYNAGYDTIPADVSEACVVLAAYLFQHGTSGNIKRKKEGQREVEYQQDAGQDSLFDQLGIRSTLDRYYTPRVSGA